MLPGTVTKNYAKDVGHDGNQWNITTASPKSMGAGHWWEWRENGGFGNARLERVGACRVSHEVAAHLKLPQDEDGSDMEIPMGNLREKNPIQPDNK